VESTIIYSPNDAWYTLEIAKNSVPQVH